MCTRVDGGQQCKLGLGWIGVSFNVWQPKLGTILYVVGGCGDGLLRLNSRSKSLLWSGQNPPSSDSPQKYGIFPASDSLYTTKGKSCDQQMT